MRAFDNFDLTRILGFPVLGEKQIRCVPVLAIYTS